MAPSAASAAAERRGGSVAVPAVLVSGSCCWLAGSAFAAPAARLRAASTAVAGPALGAVLARRSGRPEASSRPRTTPSLGVGGASEHLLAGLAAAGAAAAARRLTVRKYGGNYERPPRRGGDVFFESRGKGPKEQREDELFAQLRTKFAKSGPPKRDELFWKNEERVLFGGARMTAGINFDRYENIPVERIGGQGMEEPVESFKELCEQFEFAPELVANIERCGYDKPTPVQKHSIPASLQNTDVMVAAQTGSGKTAAFLVPMFAGCLSAGPVGADEGPAAPRGLVLAPSRELCLQTHTEARKLAFRTGLRTCAVYGGGGSTFMQMQQLAEGCDIVIATPGRLLDFLDRGIMTMSKVSRFVLDEADRMLDMGFEPQIRKIIEDFGMPAPGLDDDKRQTMMFSATFPQEMRNMALDFLEPSYLWIAVGRVGSASSTVTQHFLDAAGRDKFELLMETVGDGKTKDGKPKKMLIFTNQKVMADMILDKLAEKSLRSAALHGDIPQSARERAISSFREDRINILVATDVAARGLDIPGVEHVVNFDMPGSAEDYIHRIGRTGRIGNTGLATTFLTERETALQDLIRSLKEGQGEEGAVEIPKWMEERSYQRGGGGGFRGGGGYRGGGSRPRY